MFMEKQKNIFRNNIYTVIKYIYIYILYYYIYLYLFIYYIYFIYILYYLYIYYHNSSSQFDYFTCYLKMVNQLNCHI